MPGISTGPNARSLKDTIAETGPGLPDDAVLDDELGPGELEARTQAQVRALRSKGWFDRSAYDETEAHPS